MISRHLEISMDIRRVFRSYSELLGISENEVPWLFQLTTCLAHWNNLLSESKLWKKTENEEAQHQKILWSDFSEFPWLFLDFQVCINPVYLLHIAHIDSAIRVLGTSPGVHQTSSLFFENFTYLLLAEIKLYKAKEDFTAKLEL